MYIYIYMDLCGLAAQQNELKEKKGKRKGEEN